MKFKTESGSWYKIDKKKMTWERVFRAQRSGVIRKEEGKLVKWPIITIGQIATLFDDAIQPNCIAHAVVTSKVIELETDYTTFGGR